MQLLEELKEDTKVLRCLTKYDTNKYAQEMDEIAKELHLESPLLYHQRQVRESKVENHNKAIFFASK
ncbi:MAG: hypothetical protein ICV56_06580 [Nitrososphaeraceae archaeon]|nr:hypothetical protein [Nitrososphaeraceae archaeon]